MGHSKNLRKVLQASSRQIARGKGIPEKEFWRQVEQMRKRERSRVVKVRQGKTSKA
jgi:hypothetical protein